MVPRSRIHGAVVCFGFSAVIFSKFCFERLKGLRA